MEVCEDFAEDIGKGVAHVCSLLVTKLKLLLKCYFKAPDALSKMKWEEFQALVEDSFTAMEKETVTNMLRVRNKGKGTMLHNNIKGKGTMMHNNIKVKVQICIKYTLLVMFYYALTPTYTKDFNSYVISM